MSFLDDIATETSDVMVRGEFSEAMTLLYSATGGDVEIPTRGLFDNSYEQFVGEDGTEVSTRDPKATIYTTDLEETYGLAIAEDEDLNWRLIVRETTYRIYDTEPDGTGVIIMKLRKL